MSTYNKIALGLFGLWLLLMGASFGNSAARSEYQPYNAFTGNPVVSEEDCQELGGYWGEIDRITWQSERSDGHGTMVIEGCLTMEEAE